MRGRAGGRQDGAVPTIPLARAQADLDALVDLVGAGGE